MHHPCYYIAMYLFLLYHYVNLYSLSLSGGLGGFLSVAETQRLGATKNIMNRKFYFMLLLVFLVHCFNQEILNTSCLSLTLALQRSNESYKLIKHPLKRINILSSIHNAADLLSFSQQYFTLAALSSPPKR